MAEAKNFVKSVSFKKRLEKELNGVIWKGQMKYLPSGYNIVGNIMLLNLHSKLYKYRKKIGDACIRILPYVKTVCLQFEIGGIGREPVVEVIAGDESTETMHKENGLVYQTDVSKFMFSGGNKFEKQRLVALAGLDETVVDMFAGIGYWTLPLAKKVKRVYSIELRHDAAKYLQKNLFLNDVASSVSVLRGDCRNFTDVLNGKADRVVCGYLFYPLSFLGAALSFAKKNGVVHFHAILRDEDKEVFEEKMLDITSENKKKIEILGFRKVKSYAPKVWHVVWDLRKV